MSYADLQLHHASVQLLTSLTQPDKQKLLSEVRERGNFVLPACYIHLGVPSTKHDDTRAYPVGSCMEHNGEGGTVNRCDFYYTYAMAVGCSARGPCLPAKRVSRRQIATFNFECCGQILA